MLPMGDVISLASASMWTTILGFFVLGEKVHLVGKPRPYIGEISNY